MPPCFLCGNNTWKPWYLNKKHHAQYYQCVGCGVIALDHVHWPENTSEHYNDTYYNETYGGRAGALDERIFDERLRVIRAYVPEGASVLEVGAASGEFLHVLEILGYDVTGVELSARAAKHAERLYNIPVRIGTLKDAVYDDEQFDAVVLYHVLEHLEDPLSELREIHRILKPGGIILIEVPHPTSLDARVSTKLMRNILDFPHHLFIFPPRTLTRALTEMKFEVVHTETSVSFALWRFLKQIRLWRFRTKYLKRTGSYTEKREGVVTMDPVARGSSIRRLVSTIFPGMKLIVVARKKTK